MRAVNEETAHLNLAISIFIYKVESLSKMTWNRACGITYYFV